MPRTASRRLREENLKSKLILQVHDELLIETAREEEPRVAAILEEEMKGAAELSVALEVDMHTGETGMSQMADFYEGGKSMRVIGVTGGVGSGKSAVLNYIEAHFDARIVKADEVGHMLMMPWGKCYEPVVKLFGDWVVGGRLSGPSGHLPNRI